MTERNHRKWPVFPVSMFGSFETFTALEKRIKGDDKGKVRVG